jgi:hypothetical protein
MRQRTKTQQFYVADICWSRKIEKNGQYKHIQTAAYEWSIKLNLEIIKLKNQKGDER